MSRQNVAVGESTRLPANPARSGRLSRADDPPSLAGVYDHSFDTKFRIVIPSLFRDVFSDGGYLFQMPLEGNYVALFPTARWERWIADIRYWIESDRDIDRDLFPNVLDRARAFVLDVQGRVSIPQEFRTFARLDEAVELRGRDTHFALLRGPVAAPTNSSTEALTDMLNVRQP